VLGIERFAVELEGDPGLAPGHLGQRQVRRVAAVAVGEHVLRVGLDAIEEGVDRHALPDAVDL
jgi:hypothetical protein